MLHSRRRLRFQSSVKVRGLNVKLHAQAPPLGATQKNSCVKPGPESGNPCHESSALHKELTHYAAVASLSLAVQGPFSPGSMQRGAKQTLQKGLGPLRRRFAVL